MKLLGAGIVFAVTAAAVVGAVEAETSGNGTSPSGCEVCADTGDCTRAYHGGDGQFCGNWLDRSNERRPCCCPTNAICKVSNYACNCAYATRVRDDDGPNSLLWLWWLLGALLLLTCCGGCCFMLLNRSKQRESESAIPMAAPVSSPTPGQPYGSSSAYSGAPPQAVYSSAPPVYGGGYGRSGGMSAGTGAALGGGAGLLGGLLLGEALADHGGGDYGDGGYGGGGFDGGDTGGGDFAGDF